LREQVGVSTLDAPKRVVLVAGILVRDGEGASVSARSLIPR
jgi:hypothetical protein